MFSVGDMVQIIDPNTPVYEGVGQISYIDSGWHGISFSNAASGYEYRAWQIGKVAINRVKTISGTKPWKI